MIFFIPISFIIVGLVVLASLNWSMIISVIGLATIAFGVFLAWTYSYEKGMIVTGFVLGIIPGIIILFWGLSIG